MLHLPLALCLAIPQATLPLAVEARGPVDEPGAVPSVNLFLFQRLGTGDFDGDGRVDLWWRDLHRNRGGGRFVREGPSAVTGPGSSDGARALEFLQTLDLEGDGDLDVVAGHDLRVFENRGDGTFSMQVLASIPEADTRFVHLTAADLNGDGVVDFVYSYQWIEEELYGGYTWHTDCSFYNSSGPSMWTRSAVSGSVGKLTAFDLEGDGDLDLVGFRLPNPAQTNPSPGSWFLWEGFGGGSFRLRTSPGLGLPLAATHGDRYVPDHPFDYDGDGDVDLIVSRIGPRSSELWLNDGTGVFSLGPAFPSGVDVVLTDADLDGDGARDLIGKRNDQDLVGLRNEGGARFGVLFTINRAPGAATFSVHHVDVDEDGVRDLVVGGTRVDVYHQVAPQVFRADASSLESSGSRKPSAAGDIDGDGDPDLFLGRNEYYINDGTGAFQRDTNRRVGSIPVGIGATLFLDHDGDGDLDHFVGQRSSLLLDNDGQGFFSNPPGHSLPSLPPNSYPAQVRAGDLSGNGLPDLLVYHVPAGSGIGNLELWENQGGGVFARRSHNLVLGAQAAYDLGDIDGDGVLDVLCGDSLWRNTSWSATGSVTFQPVPVPAGFEAEVLADMDADGDLDAVTGGAVYRNDGAGTFAAATATSSGSSSGVGDFDGDGDLDSLTLDPFTGAYGWDENDGAGNLTFAGGSGYSQGGQRSLLFSPLGTGPALLVDVDLDGDVDFLWGETAPTLYANLSRGMYVHGLPGPGRKFTLSVFGPPSTPYYVAFAEKTRERYLPFGRLFLDLTTQTPVLLHGSLDSAGRAEVSISVPNLPALQNLELVGQALVGGPLRFTNADRFTLE